MEEQSAGEPVPQRIYDHEIKKPEEIPSRTYSLTEQTFFEDIFLSEDVWLIQTYSIWNQKCRTFAPSWERLSEELEGMVRLARVQIFVNDRLAALLAEVSWATNGATFRNGLPSIIGFYKKCRHMSCMVRYRGPKTYSGVMDWVSQRLLHLPEVPFFNSETIQAQFVDTIPSHKVGVVTLLAAEEEEEEIKSPRITHAPTYLRQAAASFNHFCEFAAVIYREEDADIWRERFGVQSIPATVFLKEATVEPIVHHGPLINSSLSILLSKHKLHELRQLRELTKTELACDLPPLYGRVRYCAVLVTRAGENRTSQDAPRGALREVQQALAGAALEVHASERAMILGSAATLFRAKRLSLSWLDGPFQQPFCFFHLSHLDHPPCSSGSPTLFIVRYGKPLARTSPEDPSACQVAVYDGPLEAQAILMWLDEITTIAEKNKEHPKLTPLPYPPPPLHPEDPPPSPLLSFFLQAQHFVNSRNEQFAERLYAGYLVIQDYLKNPWFFPAVGVSLFIVWVWHYTGQLAALPPLKKEDPPQTEEEGKAKMEPAVTTTVKAKDDETFRSTEGTVRRRQVAVNPSPEDT